MTILQFVLLATSLVMLTVVLSEYSRKTTPVVNTDYAQSVAEAEAEFEQIRRQEEVRRAYQALHRVPYTPGFYGRDWAGADRGALPFWALAPSVDVNKFKN